MNGFRLTVWLCLGLLGAGWPAGATAGQDPVPPKAPFPAEVVARLDQAGARQCLEVRVHDPASITATVQAWEHRPTGWAPALASFPAVIGRKGLADPGGKREGDGKSPAGVFPLGFAFGYAPAAPTRWPYHPAAPDDVWIDDPEAPDYNTLTKKGATTARSFEFLKRPDDLYKYGLVVEYNTRPVVKGHGSAIFVHLWSGPRSGTAGCVAFDEESMLALLGWLDPTGQAHIFLH
ncbi:MAG: L,D-transpeptidase family protein [Candidatus Riflebacteria bacterium]|nr:L,D-transpeptidase family protein [Candidatus Riflebacteria bacterium]